MNDFVSKWAGYGPIFQSLLRIVAGLMFLLAGTTLMFAFPGPASGMSGAPPLMSQMGIGGVLLVGGGALMVRLSGTAGGTGTQLLDLHAPNGGALPAGSKIGIAVLRIQ